MNAALFQAARRIPAHHRPLVLAVIVPLAATCLLTAALVPGPQQFGAASAQHRQDAVASLQERQRRLCECLLGENLLDDPPADVHPADAPAKGGGKAQAAVAVRAAQVPFAVERRAALPGTHESVLHYQPLPNVELRGPPA